MACLLVLVVAATVLTGPPGKLTHAARTSPAEAFWRAALPGAPMPEAIRELLRPGTTNALDDARPRNHQAADPPPMDFNYEYDNSKLRNEAAAPSADVLGRVAGARNAAASASSPPSVFFLEEAVRVGGVLAFRSITIPRGTASASAAAASSPPLRLYTVRAVRAVDGGRFLVCRRDRDAVPDGDDAVYGCRATGPGPARAYAVGVVGERGETATAAVVCRTDTTSRWNRARAAAFWLLDVKPGGATAVCHAALDAQVIPVKDDDRSSSSLV